jgi:hypothetical protein
LKKLRTSGPRESERVEGPQSVSLFKNPAKNIVPILETERRMVIPLEEEEEGKGKGIVKVLKHAGGKAFQAGATTFATTKDPRTALLTGAIGAVSSFFDE